MEIQGKKILINKYGGYDQLNLTPFPAIENPGETEVIVEVRAIGINYADVCVRWGIYESAKEFIGLPITPGFEYSGVILKKGIKVSGLEVGQQVMGLSFFGSYSSHVKVQEHLVFPLPESFSFEEGATFPCVFLTAYHALFHHIKLRPNQSLLVHSAAGGVGSALVQLGKILELETIGVIGSTSKTEYAQSFSPDHLIDKSQTSLWKEVKKLYPHGIDCICDANGVSTLKDSYQHLAPMGKLICYGFHSMLPRKGGRLNFLKLAWNYLKTPRFNPFELTTSNKSIIGFNLSFLFDQKDILKESMEQLLEWTDQKKIRPLPVTSFPLNEVGKAHSQLESGMTTGKLALLP